MSNAATSTAARVAERTARGAWATGCRRALLLAGILSLAGCGWGGIGLGGGKAGVSLGIGRVDEDEFAPPPPAPPRPLDEDEQLLVGLWDLIDLTIRRDGNTRHQEALRPWSGTLRLDADRTGFLVLEVDGVTSASDLKGWSTWGSHLSFGTGFPALRTAEYRLTQDGVLITACDLEGSDYETYSWQRR